MLNQFKLIKEKIGKKIYKTRLGYYYKELKNGSKERISKDEYNTHNTKRISKDEYNTHNTKKYSMSCTEIEISKFAKSGLFSRFISKISTFFGTKINKKNLFNFYNDFLMPLFMAYIIYLLIVVATVNAAIKFGNVIDKGDFEKYDKWLQQSRYILLFVHSAKIINYIFLLFVSLLWVLGYPELFYKVWPIQPYILGIIFALEVIVDYIFPTNPSSIAGALTILIDYQKISNLDELSNVIKNPYSLVSNVFTKIMNSKFISIFIILATTRIYYLVTLKQSVSSWLMVSIFLIISHLIYITIKDWKHIWEELNENTSTKKMVEGAQFEFIKTFYMFFGIKRDPTSSEIINIIDFLKNVSRKYSDQVKKGNFKISHNLFLDAAKEQVSPKKMKEMLKNFFIKYGTKILINRTEIGEYILLTINAADKTQAYELLKVAKTKGEQWAMELSLKISQIAKNKAIQELLGYLKYLKEKYGKMDKETIQMSILLYCALK